jgi:hypothetical protein
VNLSTKQLIRYGAFGALAVVVVAGAVYFFDRSPTASPAETADGANPPAAANPAADLASTPTSRLSRARLRPTKSRGFWATLAGLLRTATLPKPRRLWTRRTR